MQLKPGGLIRVHTSALQPTSQYKSLVISEETTSDELLSLLLSSYNSSEPVEQFSLYEVSEHASCEYYYYVGIMQVKDESVLSTLYAKLNKSFKHSQETHHS